MARKLILDTGFLVGLQRGRTDLEPVIADGDDVAIAAVTAAELLVGVWLAARKYQPDRLAFVDDVLDEIPLIDYDHAVARRHAELLAFVRREGTPRGAHDLIIAATALASTRTIVTTDAAARFADLPGVTCLVV